MADSYREFNKDIGKDKAVLLPSIEHALSFIHGVVPSKRKTVQMKRENSIRPEDRQKLSVSSSKKYTFKPIFSRPNLEVWG